MQRSTFFAFRCCFFFSRSNTLKYKLKQQIHFVLKCYYWYVNDDKRTLESVWMFSSRLSPYHNILFFCSNSGHFLLLFTNWTLWCTPSTMPCFTVIQMTGHVKHAALNELRMVCRIFVGISNFQWYRLFICRYRT